MNGQAQRYNESVAKTPYFEEPPELAQIKIDYHGLIALAKQKGVAVPELTEEEKNRFILNSTMSEISQIRHHYGF